MKRIWTATVATIATILALPDPAAAGEHRLGFGYHYWQTVDDLGDFPDLDDEGYATVFSYQYLPGGLVRFEVDVEYFPDGYAGSADKAYSPQAYVLLGRFFYAGVGVGVTRSDGFVEDEWSDPWYAARAGVDMLLLPKIHLDLNANYRADAFKELEEADTDALTFGASVRFSFF